MNDLDPGLRAWLAAVNRAQAERAGAAPDTPSSVRQALATLTRKLGGQGPELPSICDTALVHERRRIPLRLYDPLPESDKPVCLFLHGGGHMAGGIEVYDAIARRLAAASGHLVVAVEYRLAPEHPYPAGLDDSLAVAAQLWPLLADRGVRVSPHLAIAGDSGGGALTATLCAHLARHPLPAHPGGQYRLTRQVLIYPSLDYTLRHDSIARYGQGYLLEAKRIRWYFDHYFAHAEDRHAVSPLYMPAAGLPPTLIITAGLCPLRDEALAYRASLEAAGVPVQHRDMPGLIHAYLNLHELVPEACAATYAAIGAFLNGPL